MNSILNPLSAVIHVCHTRWISIRIYHFPFNSEPCSKPNIRLYYLMALALMLLAPDKLDILTAALSSTLSVIIDNWQHVKITSSKIKPLIQGSYFLFYGNSCKTVFWSTHRSTFKRFKRQSCRLRLAVWANTEDFSCHTVSLPSTQSKSWNWKKMWNLSV